VDQCLVPGVKPPAHRCGKGSVVVYRILRFSAAVPQVGDERKVMDRRRALGDYAPRTPAQDRRGCCSLPPWISYPLSGTNPGFGGRPKGVEKAGGFRVPGGNEKTVRSSSSPPDQTVGKLVDRCPRVGDGRKAVDRSPAQRPLQSGNSNRATLPLKKREVFFRGPGSGPTWSRDRRCGRSRRRPAEN
jgi:hypothetical protein